MITARVTELGDSMVVVLSKEMLERLGVGAGDEVQVGPADNGVNHSGESAVVKRQLEVAERIMDKRRDVLRRLAE